MSIVAQYLFGSHARRDFNSNSDIDLLSIINEERFSSFSEGKLNVSLYPMPRLVEAASRGDLFVMHIVREAVVVYDPTRFHDKLVGNFRPRVSYRKEIEQASDLGWYLINAGKEFHDEKVWNRRVAWCVRTILIALSAENGAPVFSPQELAKTVSFSKVALLIDRKDSDKFDSYVAKVLARFLSIYGSPAPKAVIGGDAKSAWWFFQKSSNRVALSTMDSVIDSVSKDIYGV